MRSYTTKRIELPGGRFVEVVVFDEAAAPMETHGSALAEGGAIGGATSTPAVTPDQPGLHVCPECQGELVYPVSWEERRGGSGSWEITLRCPDCEHWRTDEYSGEIVDRFDDALNDGTEQLLSDLRAFGRANMEEDVERLVRAIAQDQILPMDF